MSTSVYTKTGQMKKNREIRLTSKDKELFEIHVQFGCMGKTVQKEETSLRQIFETILYKCFILNQKKEKKNNQ